MLCYCRWHQILFSPLYHLSESRYVFLSYLCHLIATTSSKYLPSPQEPHKTVEMRKIIIPVPFHNISVSPFLSLEVKYLFLMITPATRLLNTYLFVFLIPSSIYVEDELIVTTHKLTLYNSFDKQILSNKWTFEKLLIRLLGNIHASLILCYQSLLLQMIDEPQIR